MLAYLVRRLLLIVPTLFGIMVINFIVVQAIGLTLILLWPELALWLPNLIFGVEK